jgi:hypothetical protein
MRPLLQIPPGNVEGHSREPEALAPTLAATPVGSQPGSATPPGDALPEGEIVGGRYKIVEIVGGGGQGDVYRAIDLEVEGHVVALKLLHHAARSDQEREVATRELRMLAAVTHPTIVQFKDSGWYGARLWFVMPWLEGRTLEQAMPLKRAEARWIFEMVAAGVAALHAKGMRHQDIKPSNIFLARADGFARSMPMLLDLGVAAHGDDAPIAGSPDYFAPEVAAMWPTGGDQKIGPEADVYALALTLRNVLDPETAPQIDPFSREDLDRRATVRVDPPSGRELAYLRPTFERWLALEPEKRPTAKELLRELAILTKPEDRRRDRARLLRRIAPWAAGLAVILAASAWWVSEEFRAQEKAAALVAEERRQAELASQEALAAAEEARLGERSALERAQSSAEEADAREREAHSALQRVRAAQRTIGQVRGDRARLSSALEELQQALVAAEQARVAEERARLTERGEHERALRAAREQAAQRETALAAQRDAALQQSEAVERRAQQAEARAGEIESRGAAAPASAQPGPAGTPLPPSLAPSRPRRAPRSSSAGSPSSRPG